MFEQHRRLSEPLRWGRRERTVVAILIGILLLAAVGLGAYALSSGSRARADCVAVTFASTLGAAELRGCGARAREICDSGDYRSISSELRAACAHAGFPYRPPR